MIIYGVKKSKLSIIYEKEEDDYYFSKGLIESWSVPSLKDDDFDNIKELIDKEINQKEHYPKLLYEKFNETEDYPELIEKIISLRYCKKELIEELTILKYNKKLINEEINKKEDFQNLMKALINKQYNKKELIEEFIKLKYKQIDNLELMKELIKLINKIKFNEKEDYQELIEKIINLRYNHPYYQEYKQKSNKKLESFKKLIIEAYDIQYHIIDFPNKLEIEKTYFYFRKPCKNDLEDHIIIYIFEQINLQINKIQLKFKKRN